MIKTFLIIVGIAFVIAAIAGIVEGIKRSKMTPTQRFKYDEEQKLQNVTSQWGSISPYNICPHCQKKGSVRTKPVTRKKGISGGKATGAILTGGISMLATGLSRKEKTTQAHCDNCGSTWDF